MVCIIIPYNKELGIKAERKEKVEKVFHTKKEAISQVREEAKEVNDTLSIQLKKGKIEKRVSYNPKK